MCVIDLSMCNCRTESSTQSFILVIVAVLFSAQLINSGIFMTYRHVIAYAAQCKCGNTNASCNRLPT